MDSGEETAGGDEGDRDSGGDVVRHGEGMNGEEMR